MSQPPAAPDATGLRETLAALGLDADPEMARTPEQFLGFLMEFRGAEPPSLEPLVTTCSDLVVLRDLPFHSLCAHHLLPFFGQCTLAFRPAGRLAGLGWLARTVEVLARRPELEERLAGRIADRLMAALQPVSAGVRLEARQLCLEMRGARVPATCEVTALRGAPDPALEAALRRVPAQPSP